MNDVTSGHGHARRTDIRCAIYTRKSTSVGLEQEFNSLDAQREACAEYIRGQAQMGWRAISPPYEDGGFSGASLDRPAFQRMMADVEAGAIDVIVTYKVDRLSRSLLDFAKIIDHLNRRHVGFVSVTQNFSTADAMGRLTFNMLMSFAEFEREMISERTRDKMGAARKKGKWTGGQVPFGFRVVKKKLVVNEPEADMVRRMFDLYVEHGSALAVFQSLSDQFNSYLENTGRQCNWDKHVVLRILKNPLYAGYTTYRNELYEGEHEPIVDRAKFHAVQKLIHDNARPRLAATDKYFLQGLVRCAACGAAYTPASAKRGKNKRRYYRCLTRDKQGRDACPARPLPAESLERYVVDRVKDTASEIDNPDDLLSSVRQAYAAMLQKMNLERQRLPEVIAELSAKRIEIVDNMQRATGADMKKLDDELSRLHDEQAKIERRLYKVERDIDALKKRREDAEWMIDIMRRFDSVWDALNSENKRRLLRAVVKEIVIDEPGGKVEMKMVDCTAVGTSLSEKEDGPDDALSESKPPLKTITAFIYRARRGLEIALSDKPPTQPEPPILKPISLAVLLAQAHHMQKELDHGECCNRADLARRLGLTRARLTQILNLLLLAPEIQEEILFMESTGKRNIVSERMVREIIQAEDWSQQLRQWESLKSTNKT